MLDGTSNMAADLIHRPGEEFSGKGSGVVTRPKPVLSSLRCRSSHRLGLGHCCGPHHGLGGGIEWFSVGEHAMHYHSKLARAPTAPEHCAAFRAALG